MQLIYSEIHWDLAAVNYWIIALNETTKYLSLLRLSLTATLTRFHLCYPPRKQRQPETFHCTINL